MKQEVLQKYAHLIVSTGIGLKKGEQVVIYADLDCPEFVQTVVEDAYNCGAEKVTVEWSYGPLTKVHINNRSEEVLTAVEEWEKAKFAHKKDTLPAHIYLISDDPDGMNGIDRQKFAKYNAARYNAFKQMRDEMENKYKWCIAAVPGKMWAKKMFPDITEQQAVEKLWEAIIYTSRVTDNPQKEWQMHNAYLKEKYQKLNSLNIKKLHYESANGTNLTVGLIENSLFAGGGENTLQGDFFNPNIPTEEVFISPKRGQAEGIVYSTKPLSYRGVLIEDFFIEFKDGKAVKWGAKKNPEMLDTMLNMDEGAKYLGECALVPQNSPINKSGLLFYNTLFDENASCHLAMGEGFSNCIKDFQNYTLEECRKMGINESMIHEDFMIGSDSLNIFAELSDGSSVQIFKNGNWCI